MLEGSNMIKILAFIFAAWTFWYLLVRGGNIRKNKGDNK